MAPRLGHLVYWLACWIAAILIAAGITSKRLDAFVSPFARGNRRSAVFKRGDTLASFWRGVLRLSAIDGAGNARVLSLA
jgi:hypothetical protein